MIQTYFFTKYMTRDRFTQLHRYLHLINKASPVLNDNLWRIILLVFEDKHEVNKFTTIHTETL